VEAVKGPGKPGLICAATLDELWSFGLDGAHELRRESLYRVREGFAAVTGAGIPFTLLNLVPLIDELRPAWIVNLGIAGAYPSSGLEIGEVAVGASESFADLGMETPDGGFLPMADFPFADEALRAPLPLWVPAWALGEGGAHDPVRRAPGATVNACAGSEATGARRGEAAAFESMEGAAVALAARAARIPVLETRAISNRAAARDMRPENIKLALKALNGYWASRRRHLA
jgi:futalosine hydrolase